MKMITTPTLSVVIPVYNVEKYLAECLDSALAQTLKDIEIICVDDGSTDSSGAMLDDYARRDSRIRVIHKANSGYGHTMNCGLREAKGKYIAFLESDDFIVPEAYEELVAQADECGADIAKGNWFEIRGETPDYEKKIAPALRNPDLYGRNICPRETPEVFDGAMANWAGIFRRSFLASNHILHNETPGASYQDLGFWFQAYSLAQAVYFVSKAYYCYRRGSEGSSYAALVSLKKANCICDEGHFMWAFLERNPRLMPEVAPVYFHRLFQSIIWQYDHLASFCRPRFLMDVFREELLRCQSYSHWTDSGLTDSERIRWQQIVDNPDMFLASTMTAARLNNDLYSAYCAAERRANSLAATLSNRERAVVRKPDSSRTKASVVIPVYNVQAYLEQCLKSVCEQTLREIEIICVNDGSTDDSSAILNEFAKRDSRIRIVNQENAGQSAARNHGLDLATGRYVYFIDSDDWLADKNALKDLYETAEHEKTDIIYFDAQCKFEQGCESFRNPWFNEKTYIRAHTYVGVKTGVALANEMVVNREYRVSPCLVFLRREFLNENAIRFREGIIYEDNIFTMACALAAKRAMCLPKAYYARLVRAASTMTKKKTFRNIYGYVTCYGAMRTFALRYGSMPEAQKLIDSQIMSCYWNMRKLNQEVENVEVLVKKILTPIERELYYQISAPRASPVPSKPVSANKKPTGPSVAKRSPFQRLLKCYYDEGFGYTLKRLLLWGKKQTPGNGKSASLKKSPFQRMAKCCYDEGFWYTLKRFVVLGHKPGQERRAQHIKVSIVMPVHNVAPYLRECLDSVIKQTRRDIEIICVDDGSTDSSRAILSEYAKGDSRIQVITQEPAGAGAARNRGLREARGEYLSILDADDIFAPTMLEEAVARADQTKADVVIYRHERLNHQTGKRFLLAQMSAPSLFPSKTVFSIDDLRQVKGHIWLKSVYGWTWDKLFRRSFVERLGVTFQRQPIFNDMFFTYAVMAEAKRISYLPRVLMAQRKNRPDATSNKIEKFWPFVITGLLKLHERFVDRQLNQQLPDLAAYSLHMLTYCLQNMPLDMQRHVLPSYENLAFKLLDVDLTRKEIPFDVADLAKWQQIRNAVGTAKVPLPPLQKSVQKKVPRAQPHLNAFQRMVKCYYDEGLWYTLKRLLVFGRR